MRPNLTRLSKFARTSLMTARGKSCIFFLRNQNQLIIIVKCVISLIWKSFYAAPFNGSQTTLFNFDLISNLLIETGIIILTAANSNRCVIFVNWIASLVLPESAKGKFELGRSKMPFGTCFCKLCLLVIMYFCVLGYIMLLLSGLNTSAAALRKFKV